MRRVACFLLLLLLFLIGGGCGSSCDTLVEEACEKHGEDSITCVSRLKELEDLSRKEKKLCERALIMYRSLPEGEQVE